MILTVIVLVSIGQIGLYLISDTTDFKYGRIMTFLMVLTGYLFIFPPFFYPESNPDGVNCGMPILGITLAFWIIGGGIAIVIHTIYFFIRRMIGNKLNEPEFSKILDDQE
jgi:hypothetical protein